ncbi:MAG TPA: tetratricopeptide repeat protein [Isosphaeraceae bacterium]|nr:tetratricopeptide repeat protein [Isosphaeraceae bacterium]
MASTTTTTNGSPAGVRPARRRVRLRSWLAAALRVAILVGLSAFTAWTATRSEAILEARSAFAGARSNDRPALRLALRRSLDHLGRHPNDAEAALIAGRCLTRLEFYRQAEPYFDIAERAGLLTRADLNDLALGLTLSRQAERAVAVYERILRQAPDDPDALRRLGAIRYGQMRYEDAIALGRRLAKVPGSEESGQLLLGMTFGEKHQYAPAAAAYEEVLRLDPELRRISMPADLFWSDLATNFLQTGRGADLRRYLERALERDEGAVLLDLLGMAFEQEAEDDADADAERCYRRAVDIDPTRASPWKHLGLLLERRNDLEKALEYLDRSFGLEPNDIQTVEHLKLIHYRLGHPDKAREFEEKAAEIRAKQKSTTGMGN